MNEFIEDIKKLSYRERFAVYLILIAFVCFVVAGITVFISPLVAGVFAMLGALALVGRLTFAIILSIINY